MKRLMGVLTALLIVTFAAAPAAAQGPRGDHLCFGGDTLVRSIDTPENVLTFGCGVRIQSGARVSRDVVSFGGDVVLEEGARVERDVVVFGGDVQVAGQIDRGVTVFGGRVTLEPASVVERDVLVFGGYTDKKEGAIVRGNFSRGGELDFPRVRVGPLIPVIVPLRLGTRNFLEGMLSGFLQSFVTALALAALGALILVFLPDQVKQVGDAAERSALPSLGVGCLSWLIAPPLMVLFVFTCLGIPLSAILGILLTAAAVFGWIAVSILLGDKLLRGLNAKNIVPLAALLMGLLLLWLITSIPLLGWVIWVFVASLAVGAVVLTRFGTQAYPLPASAAPAAVTPGAPAIPPAAPSQPTPPTPGDAGSAT